MNKKEFSTLVEMIEHQAEDQNDHLACVYLENGETELDRIHYKSLLSRSQEVAKTLLSLCNPGDPVLLVLVPGINFVIAFYACIFARLVAVPAFSPTSNEKNLRRLKSIAKDCTAKLIVTNSNFNESVRTSLGDKLVSVVSIEEFSNEELVCEQTKALPTVNGEDIAFLQYTSGSTSDPKGVMVTHANLISNLKLMRDAYGHTQASNFVMWVPLYHDLGLIGHMLQSAFLGSTCYMMSPEAFIKKPIRWLKAISQYRARASMAPNFAFDLCVKNVTEQELIENKIDLSSWSVAAIGAEPIRANTVQNFSNHFQSFGFQCDAFYGTYGLAEATLIVVADRHDYSRPSIVKVDKDKLQQGIVGKLGGDKERDHRSIELVSSGRVGRDHHMVVIEPESREQLIEGCIGELCFRGPSIAKGYLNKPKLTEDIFNVWVDGKQYLRTGDLGFELDGWVYVVGRIKELIVFNGVNYYPHDIEFSAYDSNSQIRRGCGAAFSVDIEGSTRLILVQEVRKESIHDLNGEEICSAVREAVVKNAGLFLDEIYLIMPSRLPKTTSGKIQRNKIKSQYVGNKVKYLYKSKFSEKQGGKGVDAACINSNHGDKLTIGNWLLTFIAENQHVDIRSIDYSDRISDYAFDSVDVVRMMEGLGSIVSLELDHMLPRQLSTIQDLIDEVSRIAAKQDVSR